MVDPATMTGAGLDELTGLCAKYWGGGLWPIVPTDGTTISDEWWSVLKAFDPDVIYSMTDLEKDFHDRLHDRLAPAILRIATKRERERGDGNTVLDFSVFDSVSSEEIAGFHSTQRTSIAPHRFLHLVDSVDLAENRQFAVRNFGLLSPTTYTRVAFETLQVEEVETRDATPANLLTRFATAPLQLVTPLDLSRLYAPRPYDLSPDEFSRGFHLVVGDSVEEALYAWNRVIISDRQAGRDVLWISAALSRDETFLRLVGEFTNRVFWNDQQQRRGKVVSYSEDVEHLNAVASSVAKVAWLGWDAVRLSRGEFPKLNPRGPGRLYYQSWSTPVRQQTEQIPTAEGRGRISTARPPFASFGSRREAWMLDLEIEYQLDPPRFSNRSDWWWLPHRAALGPLFSPGRTARITATGRPSVAVSPAEDSIPIQIPTKRAVLAKLFTAIPQMASADDLPSLPQPYFYFGTSQQGRSFRGLVELFGGLSAAGRTFDDPFWREVFVTGAGRPKSDAESAAAVIAREIKKEDEKASTGKAEASDRDQLAHRIALALHQIQPKLTTFDTEILKGIWNRTNRHILSSTDSSPRERFQDFAAQELAWLLEEGVLLQGVSIDCPICGLREWRSVDRLDSTIRCDGCAQSFGLPPEPPWRFRLNTLVTEALTREGVLPLLNAVHRITDSASDFVLAIPPQDLRESHDGEVVTDLDIIVVRDGDFIIGEVKSSPNRFDEEVLASIASVAKTVHPNRIVLAAPGKEWPVPVQERVAKLGDRLRDLGIEVQLLLLDW